MIHAFILMVLISGEQEPNPMYFRSIDTCQYYAKRIPKKYGYVGGGIKLTAYCLPKRVNPQNTVVYDR
jgi:hypothetical protein